MNTTLRMVEFITIPRNNGNVVVLLLLHPGSNSLGRYLPSAKINDLLLADGSRTKLPPAIVDIYAMGIEDSYMMEETEAFDIMDLASFLE